MNEQNTTPAALAGAAGAQKEKREPEVKIPNSFHANKKNASALLRQITWPSSFIAKEDGIYKMKMQDEKPVETWAFSLLFVVAQTCDAIGENWGLLLHIQSPNGRWHEWAMPRSLMSGNGSAYREVLLNLGLRIAPGANGELASYLTLARPVPMLQCVTGIGWHDKTYVLPDTSFGEKSGQIILQSGTTETLFRTCGTLAEWQERIGSLCPGNSRLTFAVCAAIAATLLAPLGLEGGGVHYIGDSSIGKSVTLWVAGSVAGGGGINGFLRRWRATDNAIESIATAHNDALLCLDEIGQVSAKVAAEVSYMLANGQGKSRATKEGLVRPTAEWQLIFLSNGELSLEQKLQEDNRRLMAGQAIRVLDIPVDAGCGYGVFEELHGFSSGKALAEHLQEAARHYYGTPLRAFLEAFTRDMPKHRTQAQEMLTSYTQELCRNANDGQTNRAAKRFALFASAGELAASFDVFPWPAGTAFQAAKHCFTDWIAFRGGAGPLEARTAIRRVRSFIAANRTSRFESWREEDGPAVTHNSVGFWRGKGDELEYMFTQDAFQLEVCQGANPDSIARILDAAGFLKKDPQGNYKKTHTPPRLGKSIRLYTVSGNILDADD